jgi:hypothetical protein
MSDSRAGGYPQPGHHQYNAPGQGGTVYANQGAGHQIVNNVYSSPEAERRRRLMTKILVGALVADVLYFFYGMWSYSGQNTSADAWRAGVYIAMLVVTIRLIRRWWRQRF